MAALFLSLPTLVTMLLLELILVIYYWATRRLLEGTFIISNLAPLLDQPLKSVFTFVQAIHS